VAKASFLRAGFMPVKVIFMDDEITERRPFTMLIRTMEDRFAGTMED
jgi:hypothetical protein